MILNAETTAMYVFALIMPVANFVLLIWLHHRLSSMPGSNINVRAILGAIDAVRVQMDQIHNEDEVHLVAIRAKVRDLIEMIDIYVLRVHGTTSTGKKP